jgi:hypothetical protein
LQVDANRPLQDGRCFLDTDVMEKSTRSFLTTNRKVCKTPRSLLNPFDCHARNTMSTILCGRFDRRYARLRASLEKAQRSKSRLWRTKRSCEEFKSIATGLLRGAESQNRLLCYRNGYLLGTLPAFHRADIFSTSGAKEAPVFRLSGS